MALLDRFRRGRPEDQKLPAVQQGGSHDFSSLVQVLQNVGADPNAAYAPLPRNPSDANPFGPSSPFDPRPIDRPGPNGRTRPRISEYPIAWNLDVAPHPHIPFQVLREASRNIDLIRRCMEFRKKELCAREWSFTVAPWAIAQEAAKGGGMQRVDIQAKLNKEYADDIAKANAFWRYPGRRQDYDWQAWASAALEEILAIDALCIYPHKTYGKDVLSLDIVVGSTIKPLLDEMGARPLPPYPAYQQILYGYPRGEYQATRQTIDGVDTIPGAFMDDQLYYIRRHVNVSSPFGMSAVEQALISARLYLKRQGWMLAEYDDGTMPKTWIESAANANLEEMTPSQRREWQDALNDELSGDTAARQRLNMLPPGFKANETASADERYKPDYDLHLIKGLASHFEVPISMLGYTETQGLGSSGFHEGQADSHERNSTLPDTRWFSQQISRISHEQLGVNPILVHQFTGLDAEDEAATDQVWEMRTRSARATLNEDRARQGMPAFDFPEADMPFISTTRGIVFIAGASNLVPGGVMLEPSEFGQTGPGDAAPPDPQRPDNVAASGKPLPKVPAAAASAVKSAVPDDKAAELAAFRARLKKGRNRPFAFVHNTPADLPELAEDPRVTWSES